VFAKFEENLSGYQLVILSR